MFDRAVCLLLDKRWENRISLCAEAATHGISLEFFLAGSGKLLDTKYDHVDVTPPALRFGYSAWAKRPNSYNAFLCFKKIIQKAKDDDIETLLLMEDDAVFEPNFDAVFAKAKTQLPANWDAFYLGANHAFCPTVQVSENILRLNGSGCFHAVCLRRSIFGAILTLPLYGPIDGLVGKMLHQRFNCYGCWPNIVWTKPGFSHCEGHDVDYSHYKEARKL
jgi:hypothetical protein